MVPRFAAAAALLLLASGPYGASQGRAEVLEVGPGKRFQQLSQAASAARDGDHIRLAAGEYFDCAVIARNNITLSGAGAETVITDRVCQGKALLVISGSDAVVRDLTLTRARVPDGNGAGIRQEGRNLTVERVRFINNENGILAASAPESAITVRDSEFIRNGTCRGGGCSHGIYVNALGSLRVERSVFRETREGHHIKSRARRTEVVDCEITDGPEGTASYLIDISNGGDLVVVNNRLEKGPRSENHGMAIAIGAEGVTQRTGEIRVENNRFQKDGDYGTAFVGNFTATEAMLRGNRLSGAQVRPLRGDGTVN